MMRKGMSLMEVLLAAVVLTTVMLGMAMFQTATVKTNQNERDRAFAVQKAVQMMEEILAYQVTAGTAGEKGIDSLSNGDSEYSFNLTIDDKVSDPTNPLSGNLPSGEGYRYVRQIQVLPMPSEKNARRVTVSVYYGDGAATATPKGGKPVLAMITNIVKASAIKSVPVQVYDMYLISIENTVAVWSDPVTLGNIMASTIDFIQANNPGLEIRPHWIRRLAYGRDPYYSPLVNKKSPLSDTGAVPLDEVYFYPGRISAEAVKYNPDVMQGQMWLDGVRTNGVGFGNATSALYENQGAYAFADMFNHAVRQPVEAAKYIRGGGEMSLRMLLDEMAAGTLTNAIVVNMHAELIPVPPLRNYSDAARVPQHLDKDFLKDNWGVDAGDNNAIRDGSRARLVTHPRVMRVSKSNSWDFDKEDTVDLHVYPYMAAVSGHADGANGFKTEPPDAYRYAQIVVRDIKDHLTDWYDRGGDEKDVEIHVMHRIASNNDEFEEEYVAGGDDKKRWISSRGYRWVRIWPDDVDDDRDEWGTMSQTWYGDKLKGIYLDGSPDIQNNDDAGKGLLKGDLVIKLKNVPYTHLPVNNYGLSPLRTLHGFNYFPDPTNYYMDDDLPFADAPRNTARFRIRFKVKTSAPNQVVETITTIGKEDKLQRHQYPNRSTTYTWVGATPPFSEQYQLVGDPRHNPYLDARNDKRYNRYFEDFTAAGYKPGDANAWNKYPDTFDGWGGENNGTDLPRYFELWRRALLGSTGLYLNPAGFSFYYYGHGGEFDETLSSKPFTGTSGSTKVNEFTGQDRLPSDGKWYAVPWLGELYPDAEWSTWRTRGNLPSSKYQRRILADIPSWLPDSSANHNRGKRISAKGATSFFNGGSSGGDGNWFAHRFVAAGSMCDLTDNGKAVADSFKMYLSNEYEAYRPFRLDETANYQPPEWTMSESRGWRTRLEWGLLSGPSGYYAQRGATDVLAIAPIAIRRPAEGTAGYAVMAGFAPSQDSGTSTLARMSLAAALQGYFDMGNPKFADGSLRRDAAIKQLPRLSVTMPSQDTVLGGVSTTLGWDIGWQRWNTQPYSNQYTNYQANAYRPNLVYHVKVSADGGATWIFANGGGATSKGQYRSDKRITNTSYYWNYSGYKNGEYLVMIEAYRDEPGARGTHYSYHTVSYVISR